MKIETVRNDDCTATLTVEVDPAQVQAALRAAAKKVAGQYNFAGFRRGKAPYETVLRHVGEKALMEVALETGLPVANGILTTDTEAQAEARLDKGAEAVRVAVEMARLRAAIPGAAR